MYNHVEVPFLCGPGEFLRKENYRNSLEFRSVEDIHWVQMNESKKDAGNYCYCEIILGSFGKPNICV